MVSMLIPREQTTFHYKDIVIYNLLACIGITVLISYRTLAPLGAFGCTAYLVKPFVRQR